MMYKSLLLPALLIPGVLAHTPCLSRRGVKTVVEVVTVTEVQVATVFVGEDGIPYTTVGATSRTQPSSTPGPEYTSTPTSVYTGQNPEDFPKTPGFSFTPVPWNPASSAGYTKSQSPASGPSSQVSPIVPSVGKPTDAPAEGTPAPNPPVRPAPAPVPTSAETTVKPSPTTQPSPPAQSSTTSSSVAPPKATTDPVSKSVIPGRGIAYSPYAADGTCKNQAQVDADIKTLQGYGYAYVRLYGTDCNQVQMVIPKAAEYGMKTFAGVYFLSEGYGNTFESEITRLVEYGATHGWDDILAVGVGNEDLNTNRNPPDVVLSRLNQARKTLRNAGFNGPVSHVDTVNGFQKVPEACKQSDFVAANIHPFFAGIPASEAGSFLQKEIELLNEVCGRSDIVITETGWPTNGQVNSQSVPSVSEQSKAIDSIRQHFPADVVMFSAFDDAWKKDDPSTHGSEKYWGIVH